MDALGAGTGGLAAWPEPAFEIIALPLEHITSKKIYAVSEKPG
jgi:hypothetical protein